ncbi:hypothetical protein SteCoe_28874 [Stentor coeruleus]|uniref:Uncharacterized protein n=1 Tax=Stentor coeruleus TaxID=5963 RepID=A0A1R2B794_9CILI|nr:hypothetical protein SteCoe_28874 [Stentor coeruleus]
MKVFIVAVLLLSLVSASNQLSNLRTQVGQSCASTGYLTITEFDVEPWAPVAATSATITIEVVINRPNMGVGTITYGTVNKLQQWIYEYQVIDQPYAQYSHQTFQYVIYWPTATGNYVTQVTLGGINTPPSIDGCWTVSYTIGWGWNITSN